MKFGGTSVGDASCMERVIEIIRTALAGERFCRSGLRHEWRNQPAGSGRQPLGGRKFRSSGSDFRGNAPAARHGCQRIDPSRPQSAAGSTARWTELFQAGDRLCQGTILLRELTPRTRDSISSLGERLSAPLVAAALAERGVASVAIDATELVVTDSCHGAADPCMDLTRERSEASPASALAARYCASSHWFHWRYAETACSLRSAAAVRIIPRPFWAQSSRRMKSSSGPMWTACKLPTRAW